jgi:hypothetical protein
MKIGTTSWQRVVDSRPEYIKQRRLNRLKKDVVSIRTYAFAFEDVAGTVKDLIQEGKASVFLKQACKRSAAHMQYSRSRQCRANTRCGGDALKNNNRDFRTTTT